MIIAWGLLLPSIIMFLMTLLLSIPYNRDVANGKWVEKITYTKEDEKIIYFSYIIILCSAQYIWG